MSKGELTRHAAILTLGVSALALGGWYAGLRGLHQDLARAHAERALQRVALAGAPGPIPDADRRASALTSRIQEARDLVRSTPGPDAIYDVIQRLAMESGVRLDRLEPQSGTNRAGDAKKQGGYAVDSIGFDAEIAGDYDKVVAFLVGIENDMGLSKVTSLRVAPLPGLEGDRSVVLAKITTVHSVQVTDVSRADTPVHAKEKR
jgi:hypothetical protein